MVWLGLRKEDAGRLAALPPREYKFYVADRCRQDPLDLSGLSALEPNDLYCLAVYSLVRRADADRSVLEPIRHLTGLKILRLHGTGVTDKGMEYLRELRSLRALEFSEPLIGNQGLAVLKDLPHLEYLDLDTGATDEGFKHLGQFPSLRWLRIRTGRIWGPGLAELAHLPRLERLCIHGNSPLSDRHLQYLEGLTHLKSLSLWGEATALLTDASLASIGKLRSLEELHFVGWSAPAEFTPKGVACLKNLKNLKKLDFGLSWAGPPGRSLWRRSRTTLGRDAQSRIDQGNRLSLPRGHEDVGHPAESQMPPRQSKRSVTKTTTAQRGHLTWPGSASWRNSP